jgi:hypothetical protein
VAGRSVSGTSDTILCDSATAIRDRNTTIVYTSTSNVAITVPSAAATGCGSGTQGDSNFAFATVIAPASGTATYTFTPTTSTLTVVTGSTVTLASTSVVLAPGNFATWTSPDNVNYIVRVTNASGGSGGPLNNAVAVKTSNYSLLDTDGTIICKSGATMTLPTSPTTTTRQYIVKDLDAGNGCPVTTGASGGIDGNTTVTLAPLNSGGINAITVQFDSTDSEWVIE